MTIADELTFQIRWFHSHLSGLISKQGRHPHLEHAQDPFLEQRHLLSMVDTSELHVTQFKQLLTAAEKAAAEQRRSAKGRIMNALWHSGVFNKREMA